MTGRDFIDCAQRLARGPAEADLRSAVSRAYYGAFHIARELLEAIGVRLPRTEQVHVKVGYCLQDCGEANAARAGQQQLEVLRTERKRADYDLDDARLADRRLAETAVLRARRITEVLDQCRIGSAAQEFRVKARAHAMTLGLPVGN